MALQPVQQTLFTDASLSVSRVLSSRTSKCAMKGSSEGRNKHKQKEKIQPKTSLKSPCLSPKNQINLSISMCIGLKIPPGWSKALQTAGGVMAGVGAQAATGRAAIYAVAADSGSPLPASQIFRLQDRDHSHV